MRFPRGGIFAGMRGRALVSVRVCTYRRTLECPRRGESCCGGERVVLVYPDHSVAAPPGRRGSRADTGTIRQTQPLRDAGSHALAATHAPHLTGLTPRAAPPLDPLARRVALVGRSRVARRSRELPAWRRRLSGRAATRRIASRQESATRAGERRSPRPRRPA